MSDVNDVIMWSPGVTLEAIEKEVILKAFHHYRGVKTATANALGIAIRTLDTKLEKYEVERKAQVDKDYGERKRREEFLKRQRGIVGQDVHPNAPQTGTEMHSHHSATGVSMEPAALAPAKHAVPMQERGKIQTMLPGQTAQGHSRKAR